MLAQRIPYRMRQAVGRCMINGILDGAYQGLKIGISGIGGLRRRIGAHGQPRLRETKRIWYASSKEKFAQCLFFWPVVSEKFFLRAAILCKGIPVLRTKLPITTAV